MRFWMAGFAAVIVACFSGCVMVDINPNARRGELKEEVIEPSESWFNRSKIAMITLSGEITGESKPDIFGNRDSSVIWIKDQLKKAEEDDQVKAVVLRIDSPGGDVTASDIIYRELKMFKDKRKVPVLACMLDTGASGGYYVALAADHIYAHPTTITGSIGVVAQIPSIEKLGEKVGVEMRVIKSGPYKDMGSIWHAFQPEEQQILQKMIQTMYERFVGVVAENRPNLDPIAVRQLADGRIYTASEAKASGLIDDVKYLDQVLKLAKAQAGETDASVIVYKRPSGYRGNIYAHAEEYQTQVPTVGMNLGGLTEAFTQPRVQYIWKP